MNLYTILIIYFIFVLFQKPFNIFMGYKFPTYEDIEQATPFWKNLYKLRVLTMFISITIIAYIFTNFKVNHYTVVILCLFLANNINFLLFSNHYIYYIIQKNDENNKFVRFMSSKTNVYLNCITILYVFYAIFKIFIIK